MKKEQKYRVIGLMSGTSLDGVDIAYVEFEHNKKWQFDLGVCDTILYPEKWRIQLSDLYKQSDKEIQQTDIKYGLYLGNLAERFIQINKLQVDLICSHGHTIFHQPENNYTLQIGNGQSIANHFLKVP